MTEGKEMINLQSRAGFSNSHSIVCQETSFSVAAITEWQQPTYYQ